jgi:hypothetical protein
VTCLQQEGLATGWEGGGDEPGAVAGAAGFLHLDCGGAAISIVLLVSILVNYIAYSILLMNNSSLDVKIHD